MFAREIGNDVTPLVYEIWTAHGTVLCRHLDNEIGHTSKTAGFVPVFAVTTSESSSDVSLVAADGAKSVGFVPDSWRSPIYPMRRWRQAANDVFALASPYSGKLVIALPLQDGNEENRCIISSFREAADWECFRFAPAKAVPPAVRGLAGRAVRLELAARQGGLRSCLQRDEQAEDVEIVARLTSERDFEQIATDLLDEPTLQLAFDSVSKRDPFAIGLRNLLATQSRPQTPPRRGWFGNRITPQASLTPQLDLVNDRRFSSLASSTEDGTYHSFAHKLTAIARRRRTPTKRLCVLATVRDEGPYLLEWIAYHRTLGVEHFFIYSNGNTDGSDSLLDALANAGVVTWIENQDAVGNIQCKAWGHCLAVVPSLLDYEWCAVLDADEFIALREERFATIPDYITWQESQPVDVIVLTWNVFWSSGHRFWTDELTIARFNRQSHPSGLGKSIIRPRKFNFSHPHHPASSDHTVAVVVHDSLGEQQTYPRGQMTSHVMSSGRYGDAWINHYFSRSAEELLWKWSRGRGDSDHIAPFADMPENFIRSFMDTFDQLETPIDDVVLSRLSPVRREIESLLALPGVRDKQAEVVRHRQSWAQSTSKLLSELRRPDLSSAKQAFLELLAEPQIAVVGVERA